MARVKTLKLVHTPDEGSYLVNGHFQANGAADPAKATIFGDEVASVTYVSPGKWTVTLKTKPARCRGIFVAVSTTADGVDFVGKADWTNTISAGTFTVRTMTGATETNPTSGTEIAFFAFMKKTTRRARKR